jgi:type II secretory pathway component GspD/PulD (secretin)
MTLKQARRLSTQTLLALALTILPISLAAHAQDNPANPDCSKLATRTEMHECAAANAQTKTIFLKNATNQTDANEILVAVRNTTDPDLKLYLLESQNAIVVSTYPQELAKIEALIHDLDRLKKTYRLTYTVTEIDNNKPTGTQHYSMVVTADKETAMKEGTKVPVVTGSYADGTTPSSGTQTQFTYLDIGMNFNASIAPLANGVRLKYKVEQSSLGTPVTIEGITEPVVRQSVLDSSTVLTLDKPVMLGSIDVPDSTRHLDIAVVAEEVSNPNK